MQIRVQCRKQNPKAADGEEDEESGVGEGDEGPEEAEEEPGSYRGQGTGIRLSVGG